MDFKESIARMNIDGIVHAKLRKKAVEFLKKKNVTKIYHEVRLEKFSGSDWKGSRVIDVVGIKNKTMFIIELEMRFHSIYTPALLQDMVSHQYFNVEDADIKIEKLKKVFYIFIPKVDIIKVNDSHLIMTDIVSEIKIENDDVLEFEPPLFRGKMSVLNQVTIPKHIRMKYFIRAKNEIVLEYIGKVETKEKISSSNEEEIKKEE